MIWLTVLYAFAGCWGFCFVFHLRGPGCQMLASLGGAVGWSVFLALGGMEQEIMQYFIATLALAVYAEIIARLTKKPATCTLIIAVLPLVPGGGIYYTMKYCLERKTSLFIQTGFHTLAIAGALAAGILTVVSLTRLIHMIAALKTRKSQGKTIEEDVADVCITDLITGRFAGKGVSAQRHSGQRRPGSDIRGRGDRPGRKKG